MLPCFQNGVKNEYRPKTWLFKTKLRFWPDPTPGFKNALFFWSKISNRHFTVGVSRNKKNLIFELGVIICVESSGEQHGTISRSIRDRERVEKVIFRVLLFRFWLIFSDFRWFSVGFGNIRNYKTLGPDPEGATISKKIIMVKNDLKHPQTTIESHLDGFGGDWDRLG